VVRDPFLGSLAASCFWLGLFLLSGFATPIANMPQAVQRLTLLDGGLLAIAGWLSRRRIY